MTGVINSQTRVAGMIESQTKIIEGKIIANVELTATVCQSSGSEAPAYTDDYEITPTSREQILQTKDKFLKQDIVVKSIPYFETSNEEGTTVYIGVEV